MFALNKEVDENEPQAVRDVEQKYILFWICLQVWLLKKYSRKTNNQQSPTPLTATRLLIF